MEDNLKEKYLNKVGMLCIALTKDYRRETLWMLDRIESQEGESLETKFKRREVNNNFEIGAFVIDISNRKYFKICRIDDEGELHTHAFVSFEDGTVYKPKTETTANKALGWDIDECIRVADWRGYYLNKDPKIK